MCRLEDIGLIGPDIRDVRDGFEPTDAVTAYPMVANHDTNKRRRLTTAPDRYLAPLVVPRPGRRLKPVDQLWTKSGRLLLGARFWLNTTRVVAMWSENHVLASMWWPIRIKDAELEKASALWFNSSLGLLTLLATRNTTRGGWVQLKKADLRQLPVLDPRQLSSAQLQALSDLFDELADAEFERLPGMADCPARTALDAGISEVSRVCRTWVGCGCCWLRSRWFVIGGCEGVLLTHMRCEKQGKISVPCQG